MGNDPIYGHFKQLRVDYVLDGKKKTEKVPEHDYLEIPDAGNPDEPPPFGLSEAADGRLEVTGWAAGAYELVTASGRRARIEVPAVPPAHVVPGPWVLRFPPDTGAPDKIVLDELISWTDHPDKGVRYFSGTAVYASEIDVPDVLLGPGKRLFLDLGQVKHFAEPVLNGESLGVLWKPPFRVEITSAAHPGPNRLEVKVTNLWPNRLIGDEWLPDDCAWEDKRLKEWPEWLLKGKPRSTGRIAFTTWKHYSKDSPLLESGLLGPVRLIAAVVAPVKP
jgi:hypothetical protein